jgi:carbamoyltransferase
VTKDQNENFYNLISAFYKESGVPMLFNTSFNLGGDPLVETLEDAVETLKRSDIEYLYLPEYKLMIVVKNMFTYKVD